MGKSTKTAQKSAAKSATVSKGKKEATKTEKKPAAPVDSFGSRIGSDHAIANAMLSKKVPVTMKEIVAKTGGKTMYNHINFLIREKKLVKKTKDGYLLA